MYVKFVGKTVGLDKYSDLNSEEIVAAIARHGVVKEDNGKLVRYLMDHKHWSPLDMINFVFEIETSRAMGRHIIRHSSLKPQEYSQRYSDRVQFEPIELRKESKVNRQSSTEIFNPNIIPLENPFTGEDEGNSFDAQTLISEYLEDISSFYNKLLKAGVAKECARMILPECTTTTMTFNGTLRSWLSFLNVRVHEDAQKEVRDIAYLIGKYLENELPNVFNKINWKQGLFM